MLEGAEQGGGTSRDVGEALGLAFEGGWGTREVQMDGFLMYAGDLRVECMREEQGREGALASSANDQSDLRRPS